MTTNNKKKRRTSDYKEFLSEQLKDPEMASGYLTECFEEGEDVFLLGIKDVVEARGGIGALAKATSLNREGLYDMLSEKGNPRLSSLTKVLHALGMKLQFAPSKEQEKEAA
jgi:probable addiction module antidote protein